MPARVYIYPAGTFVHHELTNPHNTGSRRLYTPINGLRPAVRRLVVHHQAVPDGPGHDGLDVHDGAAAAAELANGGVPTSAGHPAPVHQLLHEQQLLFAAHSVLLPDPGHVRVPGALPLRRDGGRAVPARRGLWRGAGAAAQRVRPATQRLPAV
jgi:hypothetical protein